MKRQGRELRLTVIIDSDATYRHKPVYTEIVHRAHAAGLSGASVLHGIEGYGSHSVVHTARILSLSDDLPAMVVVVDEPEAIHRFLPQLDELISGGLVTLEEVDAIHYTPDESRS